MWDRFLAEARTAAKLDHPHIVYIHSVKEKDRFLYFVMKHIDGRSLDDLLAQHKPFPVPVAQTILAEVARGLDYAHREGVIHRDIKPANIMVDQKGQSIVMDFGIARAAETEHFTQTGATIGTPAYMSPEQCHGAETSAASDQYSLGILAYELLTGAPPFSGTPIELQIAHMQDTPIPIRDRRSDLSLELSGAVMRMLLKKPEERWASLRELVPIFSRGLEALGEEPRDELIAMVKSGGARRKSFPATPLSPLPVGMPKPPVTPYPARASSDTMAVDYMSGDLVAQNSAEREAPTEISGPMFAVSSPASEVMWKAANSPELDLDGFGAPAGAAENAAARAPRRMPARTATIVSSGVVLAVIGALALRGGKKTAAPAAPAPAPVNAASVSAPSPGASVTVQRLSGDSTAVGVAPGARAGAGSKSPREVSVDAVALLQLTLSKSRAAPGDTIPARLDALDDAGKPVTTSQIVWTSSDPAVVRFAGPGQLIAVKAGKATITVTAGTTTTGRELTVVAKKR
jgi:serine/threonine-protein kinase